MLPIQLTSPPHYTLPVQSTDRNYFKAFKQIVKCIYTYPFSVSRCFAMRTA